MKKLLIISLAALAGISLHAQGTVNFQNASGSPFPYLTNGITGQRIAVGTTFQVALYFAPGTAGEAPADVLFGQLQANSGFSSPGLFIGGQRTAPTTPGGPGWFWVKAWEAVQGTWGNFTSFETGTLVQRDIGGRAQLAGTSVKFFLPVTGNPLEQPPGKPVAIVPGMNAFIMTPVPEPSVIGLGVLGFGVLMLLRRRK